MLFSDDGREAIGVVGLLWLHGVVFWTLTTAQLAASVRSNKLGVSHGWCSFIALAVEVFILYNHARQHSQGQVPFRTAVRQQARRQSCARYYQAREGIGNLFKETQPQFLTSGHFFPSSTTPTTAHPSVPHGRAKTQEPWFTPPEASRLLAHASSRVSRIHEWPQHLAVIIWVHLGTRAVRVPTDLRCLYASVGLTRRGCRRGCG
jgi:hypothetical protein